MSFTKKPLPLEYSDEKRLAGQRKLRGKVNRLSESKIGVNSSLQLSSPAAEGNGVGAPESRLEDHWTTAIFSVTNKQVVEAAEMTDLKQFETDF